MEQVRAANRTARHNVYAYRLAGGQAGSATPMTVNRPRRREPRHWKYCSTAV